MAKLKEFTLVESDRPDITSEARKILADLNIEVRILPPDPIFERRFELPLLETDDGHRYFGIKGIARFAECYSKTK